MIKVVFPIFLMFLSTATTVHADDNSGWSYLVELKTHYRDSEQLRLLNPFPFPPDFLPPGQTRGFLETVDEGSHFETSRLTLQIEGRWSEKFSGKLKIDAIDRYDRNPTSDDQEWDIDEAWIRYGRETEPARMPDGRGGYVKIGKFAKFERLDERRLESYGLAATAFNRFEDLGLEVGFDVSDRFYLKASLTHGNPVFFRDPNALAGDNGNQIFDGSVVNPIPELQSGFPIFYDTDVDEIDFENPEIGVGAGLRWSDETGRRAVDVFAWGYQRDLADTVDLRNTFYGGDLDLLLGPGNSTPLPVTGDEKKEYGVNLCLYLGGFTLFGQWVDQDLAGLDRTGFEFEAAWDIELPYFGAIGGNQVLPFLSPVIRYSKLDPDFALHPIYPAPSVAWKWEKLDVGLRATLLRRFDLTVESSRNEFIRQGKTETYDEFLATLTIAFSGDR